MVNFYQRVALVVSQIPTGRLTTYGQIALLCGMPRRARQVGYALGKGLAWWQGNPPPAHRVVNHQGFLSGNAAFDGQQQLLLEQEGIVVTDGRVDLKKYGWRVTLEQAEQLAASFQRLKI